MACTPVTAAAITLSPTSPVVAGTTVNLTATKTDTGTPTTYIWASNPNTGFTSTLQNATLTNPTAGTYNFTVTVQNTGGTGVCTATATASLSVSTALVPCTPVTAAAITLSPTSPVVAGTTVNLTASKTDAGTPTTYTWASSPSTGFTSTLQNATLTNPAAGTYNFTVTVQNNNGTGVCTATATASLSVSTAPLPCTPVTAAAITLSPTSPVVAGTTVNLTATKTDAGTPTTYTWASNPATGFTSTLQNATLTNPAAGTYNFTVTVQNNNGTGVCTATATASLSVSTAPLPCTPVTAAAITLSPTSPVVAGTTVNLTATKTDAGTPTTYTWASNPNTGFTSTLQNAMLTNPVAGTYNFTVTVQNNNGTGVCTATATSSLSVSSACVPPTTTALINPPTCAGVTAQSNGLLRLVGFTNERYQYVTGSTFTGTATPASPTAIPSNSVLISTLSNTAQTYTVRIYTAGSNTCFSDRTVSLEPVVCTCPPAKCVGVVITVRPN